MCVCVCALHLGWHAINNALTLVGEGGNVKRTGAPGWMDTTEMIDLNDGESKIQIEKKKGERL